MLFIVVSLQCNAFNMTTVDFKTFAIRVICWGNSCSLKEQIRVLQVVKRVSTVSPGGYGQVPGKFAVKCRQSAGGSNSSTVLQILTPGSLDAPDSSTVLQILTLESSDVSGLQIRRQFYRF